MNFIVEEVLEVNIAQQVKKEVDDKATIASIARRIQTLKFWQNVQTDMHDNTEM